MGIAADLARVGLHVFPCAPDKKPRVRWKEAATTNLDQIGVWRRRWPDSMIGLPCGSQNDICVIDLDICKETGNALGVASLSGLGLGHLLNGPQVRTPSGGRHLYFQNWESARNSAGRLAPGIDVRAEGGYVIAPGSRNASGSYQGVIEWDSLPRLPLSLKDLLRAPMRPPAPVYTGAENATTAVVRDLLSYIPPDAPYGDWLNVLLGLHSHYAGSDEGLQLALNWSAQGTKFRPGEVERKWRGFRRGGVTFATVAALARENGANLSSIAAEHRRSAA